MDRACSTHGENKNVNKILAEKRSLGFLRRRWGDNIKINLRGRGWCGMNWITLAQDRD
jgi:hypothetical protein